MGQEDIVRYWQAVELLQPQSVPERKKRSDLKDPYFHDLTFQQLVPPWTAESMASKEKLPKKYVWSHTLFAHVYDNSLIAEKLEEAFGADQGYREPQPKQVALFAAKFTADGLLVEHSLVLSSEAWFLGKVLAGKDWGRGFEEDQQTARKQAEVLHDYPASGKDLKELTRWILRFLGVAEFFAHLEQCPFRFRSQPVLLDKPVAEDDPLNSFFLSELADVADHIRMGEKSEPLSQYLRMHDPQQRLDVDDDLASMPLIEWLMPDAYPSGCWPSERHVGLVHSQQLAVNTILSTLGEGQGLLGINGPPGTGKTTLLRDLIAAIVTRRADVLAGFPQASAGFVKDGREKGNDGGRAQIGFKLNPVLYGYEIVVASSNNGAVENVTLELPLRDKIDESWLPDAEYFSELGELVSGKPAWGLISGALGSKKKRGRFIQRCLYGDRDRSGTDQTTPEADENMDADEEAGHAVDAQPSGPIVGDEQADDNDKPGKVVEQEVDKKGFLGWLKPFAERNESLSPVERKVLWQQAVANYKAVKAAEQLIVAQVSRIREMVRLVSQAKAKVADRSAILHTLEQELVEVHAQLGHLDNSEYPAARLALQQCRDDLERHTACKPRFWVKLFSLWGAQRRWSETVVWLTEAYQLASAEFNRIERLTRQLTESKGELERQHTKVCQALRQEQDQCKVLVDETIELARACEANHLIAWLQGDTIGRGDAIELAEPWCVEGWRQARARVFIQALKLHRTFFELEAKRVRSNLELVNVLMMGTPTSFQGFSHDAIRSAWATLFMVVPVLSSTFASFARTFGSLAAGEIGWLLIDEAGQSPPQAAVGALWRSRRALLVGDPLQLKPIVPVSDAVLEHMRTHYRVDSHWLPNRQSAQTLADAATPWGRMVGPSGGKAWVGLPLVVHRRCDKPMYELANRIAYDGKMVYGTLAPVLDKETRPSLATGWIQASGLSQGNWIRAEGEVLTALLERLRWEGVNDKDIAVITPFKDVQRQLKEIVGDKVVSGTIHTMQGKEAQIVILILGGNSNGSGARDWVVSAPNLLNVAATRAKRRFYVIGDRNDWKKRSLFCEVMDLLPLQEIRVREQAQMPLFQ